MVHNHSLFCICKIETFISINNIMYQRCNWIQLWYVIILCVWNDVRNSHEYKIVCSKSANLLTFSNRWTASFKINHQMSKDCILNYLICLFFRFIPRAILNPEYFQHVTRALLDIRLWDSVWDSFYRWAHRISNQKLQMIRDRFFILSLGSFNLITDLNANLRAI